MLQIPRGIKNVPFSVCYKFCTLYAKSKMYPFQYVTNSVPYTRNQNVPFSVCYKFRTLYTESKRTFSVCYKFRTDSVPIPYFTLNLKRGNFSKPYKKYVNSVYIFLRTYLTYVNSVFYFL